MSRTVCIAWCIAALLLLAGTVTESARAATTVLRHDHLGPRCAACHVAGDRVTPDNAGRLQASQARLCGTCHQGGMEASHPTGVVPGRAFPAHMPVDWKGEMACSTCHNVHRTGGGPNRGAVAAGKFAAGGAQCSACHRRASFARMADRGESLLLPAGTGTAHVATAMPPDDHLGPRCAACHIAGDRVTPDNAGRLKASQERLCGACHEGAKQASHPTGFVPGRALSAHTPVDWKGEMTCSTCHNVHRTGGESIRGAVATGEFGAGSALCSACHSQAFFARMLDRGESLLRSAHLDARANRSDGEIDVYSQHCLDCHPDQLSLPGAAIRVAFTASNGTGMTNHPIGMTYIHGNPMLGLRAPAAFPAEILLPNGKVSCLSCHEGYSARHGAMVMERPTDLCLACHDK